MSRFSIFLFLASLTLAQARLSTPARISRNLQTGTQTFEDDAFLVTITGNSNVPKYVFESKTDEDGSQYMVMFQKMFESRGGQKLGNTQISLPSLSWTMAAAESEEGVEETAFWINATGSDRFETLAFRNVLVGTTVKFDVILDGYSWRADDSDALDLIWKLTNSTDDEEEESAEDPTTRFLQDATDEEPISETDTSVCYAGDGGVAGEDEVCFSIVPTAQATVPATTDGEEDAVTEVDVTVASDGDEGGLRMTYARFEGNLFHDPTFGITEETAGEGFFARIIAFIFSPFTWLWNLIFGN